MSYPQHSENKKSSYKFNTKVHLVVKLDPRTNVKFFLAHLVCEYSSVCCRNNNVFYEPSRFSVLPPNICIFNIKINGKLQKHRKDRITEALNSLGIKI